MWWLKAIQAAVQALKAGYELANPAAWKNTQAVASLLAALAGLLWALGFRFQVLPEDILAVAGIIVAIANAYFTIATSRKVGLPNAQPKSPADLSADLPPVELQARPLGDEGSQMDTGPAVVPAVVVDDPAADPYPGGVRDPVPTQPRMGAVRPPVERPLEDQFSGGWGDR